MVSKLPPVYPAILKATGNYTDEETLLFEKEARVCQFEKNSIANGTIS